MKRTLVFIGGAHGVGKTTVISRLKLIDPTLAIFDPGELFWKYYYNEQVLSPKRIERMVFEALQGTTRAVTLVNWHYAVWQTDGYIPQIELDWFKELNESAEIENIVLILLDLPFKQLFARRKKDNESGIKSRKLIKSAIIRELSETRRLFVEHAELVLNGCKLHEILIFTNYNSEATAKRIAQVLKHYK